MRKHFQNISLTTVFGFFLFLFAVIPVTALVINFYFLFSQNTTHDIQSRLANIEEDVYRFVQSNKVYLDEQVQTLLSSRSLLFAVNTKSESDLITIATNYLSKTSVSQIEFYDDQDEGIVSVFKKDDKIISTTLASTEKVKTYSDATLGLSYNEEPALISVREIVSDNEKIGSIKQVIAIPTTRWFELAGSQAVDVFILTKRNKLIYSSLGDLSVLDLKQLQSIDTDSLVEVSLKYNKYSLKRISDGELTIIVGANHRTYQQ